VPRALTGAAEQIGYLRRHGSPFNVNSVALACLEEAPANQSFPQRLPEGFGFRHR
jgi:hypothetical protein